MSRTNAFKQSVIGLQSSLMSHALKLTLDKEEAQDLVQDTTLKALDNEEKFVVGTNLGGWMNTIMRNIFINNYRKRARESIFVDISEDLYHINLSQESGFETPEGAYASGEINAILRSFPAEYRAPFVLRIAGYRYSEIAEKLNMPLGTVKSRIFITRNKLRELLKDYR